MINWKIRKTKRQQSQPNPHFIEVGDTVQHEDGRTGTLKRIASSPYYVEEVQGIVRGYVQFDGSADWCLATELTLIAKATTAEAAIA